MTVVDYQMQELVVCDPKYQQEPHSIDHEGHSHAQGQGTTVLIRERVLGTPIRESLPQIFLARLGQSSGLGLGIDPWMSWTMGAIRVRAS
jgi:hypothetical protein